MKRNPTPTHWATPSPTTPLRMNTPTTSRLRLSLEAARSRLSPRQRQLLEGLLSEYPMSHLSQRLGVPRATLYDELERIRRIFRDEGLHQFLDESDS
ncbi:MAG: hypothetical protein ACE5Q6_17300 [Dehalococcoidia bacterium]